jgi:hypothetical protein
MAHIDPALEQQVLYRPGERVAILTTSSILKLQLKRIHAEQDFAFSSQRVPRANLSDGPW